MWSCAQGGCHPTEVETRDRQTPSQTLQEGGQTGALAVTFALLVLLLSLAIAREHALEARLFLCT